MITGVISTNQFNASSITAAQWDAAAQYFARNPSHVKMRRKEQDTPLPFSFIKVDGVIYAMDRDYLGDGGLNKVKKGITRKGEIVKINITALDLPEMGANEELVTKKIGEYKGKARATLETKKEFWKHLIGTPEQRDEEFLREPLTIKFFILSYRRERDCCEVGKW